MPSEWAETKLCSRHGDDEHAVVPQPVLPLRALRSASGESPRGGKYWSALQTLTSIAYDCHSEARLPGRRHRETKQD